MSASPRFTIEVTVPAHDERGNVVGYEGREVWTGDDPDEARRVLAAARHDFEDRAAMIREFSAGRFVREFD